MFPCSEVRRRKIAGISSALKYRPPHVHKHKRVTDACRHCENLRRTMARRRRLLGRLATAYPKQAKRCKESLQKWSQCSTVSAALRHRVTCLVADIKAQH